MTLRVRRTLSLLVLLLVPVIGAARPAGAGVRDEHPNLIGGELGGRGIILTLNYERFVNNSLGVGAGVMAVGWGGGVAAIVPIYLSLAPGDVHSPYLSAGVSMIGGGASVHEFEGVWLGQVAFGYQFQSRSGFFVRPLFTYMTPISGGDNEVLLWPGLTIGGSF